MRIMIGCALLLTITACQRKPNPISDSSPDAKKRAERSKAPVQPKPVPRAPTPSFSQLKAARAAFQDLEATYATSINPRTKRTEYRWTLPVTATDVDLQGIPDVPFGFALVIQGPVVTPKGLAELGRLKNLTSLTLKNIKLADKGGQVFEKLTHLKYLHELDLTWIYVSEDSLEGLKYLKDLNYLNIGLTDKVLQVMRKNGQLHTLANVGGDKGRPSDEKGVTSVNFWRTMVTDAGMKELRSLPNLKYIYLSDTKVTDVGIRELKHLSNIQGLWLQRTKVTAKSVKELRLKNVTSLDIADSYVGLEILKELDPKKLERLTINAGQLVSIPKAEWKKFPRLKELTVYGIDGMTLAQRQEYKVLLPNVKIIEVIR